jgi:23S rRNA pseudouridine2457 synthase
MTEHRYFILYKPVDMVSQFKSTHNVRLLGDINFDFPEGTHAIGRLDKDSEGLLLLTTNKKVTRLLFQGKLPHKRTYLVQVKNVMSEEIANRLARGVEISATHGNSYLTTPCLVKLIEKPLFVTDPTIQLHEKVKNSWISITLTEGKFHQVRKMVKSVGHPCVRLIRESIEGVSIIKMLPGDVIEITGEEFFEKLKL